MELDKVQTAGRPSEREMVATIERVKLCIGQATGGVKGFEQVLRKFGSGVNIS